MQAAETEGASGESILWLKVRAAIRLLVLSTLGGTVVLAQGTTHVVVTDAAGQPVEDAVVVAVPSAGVAAPAGSTRTAVIDQIDKEFVPMVSVVRTKTAILFPNKDNIRHQVYSVSTAKKFELPLYKGKPSAPVVFEHPGLVVLGCNIHDWMLGYVYVVDSPWFAKTDRSGKADVVELPAGEYDVAVYHPRAKDPAEPVLQRVTIGAGPDASLSYQLNLRKPVSRPHVPKPGRPEYE